MAIKENTMAEHSKETQSLSEDSSILRLKHWLDFWKVIFGTAVVGVVTAIFGFVIDWRGKDLDVFNARSNFYNIHAKTIIENDITERIVLADYFRRFSPVIEDRPGWENYWQELKEKQARNPELITSNTKAIQTKTSELNKLEQELALSQESQAKETLTKEIAQLENNIKQLISNNAQLETELSGIRTLSQRSPIPEKTLTRDEFYPAGKVGQPRGLRNNNPVLVDTSPWDGRMPQNLMTPIQQAETTYAVFIHPRWSFRAGAKVMLNHVEEKGKDLSVYDHLFKWLSGSEHSRRQLAQTIEQELNLTKDSPVKLTPKVTETILNKLTILMNGSNPYPQFIIEGMALLPEFTDLSPDHE